MKKYFVVMNPVSGTIKVEEIESNLKKYLKDNFDLYVTTGRENVPNTVRKAVKKGAKIIIAIGGDGTLSECAEAVIRTKIPLVIVPTGTANNLAQELHIPLLPEDAISLAVKRHKISAVDAMQVGGHYFFLDVSIGARSLAVRDTTREAKLKFGILAYAVEGLQKLIHFNPSLFTINADGKINSYSATEVVIANAGIFGVSAFRYSKSIRVDDGVLNICIIKANTIIDYLKIAYRFFTNSTTAQDRVQFLTSKDAVLITTSTQLPIQADGEIIGKGEVKVRLAPRSLRVVVPQ